MAEAAVQQMRQQRHGGPAAERRQAGRVRPTTRRPRRAPTIAAMAGAQASRRHRPRDRAHRASAARRQRAAPRRAEHRWHQRPSARGRRRHHPTSPGRWPRERRPIAEVVAELGVLRALRPDRRRPRTSMPSTPKPQPARRQPLELGREPARDPSTPRCAPVHGLRAVTAARRSPASDERHRRAGHGAAPATRRARRTSSTSARGRPRTSATTTNADGAAARARRATARGAGEHVDGRSCDGDEAPPARSSWTLDDRAAQYSPTEAGLHDAAREGHVQSHLADHVQRDASSATSLPSVRRAPCCRRRTAGGLTMTSRVCLEHRARAAMTRRTPSRDGWQYHDMDARRRRAPLETVWWTEDGATAVHCIDDHDPRAQADRRGEAEQRDAIVAELREDFEVRPSTRCARASTAPTEWLDPPAGAATGVATPRRRVRSALFESLDAAHARGPAVRAMSAIARRPIPVGREFQRARSSGSLEDDGRARCARSAAEQIARANAA